MSYYYAMSYYVLPEPRRRYIYDDTTERRTLPNITINAVPKRAATSIFDKTTRLSSPRDNGDGATAAARRCHFDVNVFLEFERSRPSNQRGQTGPTSHAINFLIRTDIRKQQKVIESPRDNQVPWELRIESLCLSASRNFIRLSSIRNQICIRALKLAANRKSATALKNLSSYLLSHFPRSIQISRKLSFMYLRQSVHVLSLRNSRYRDLRNGHQSALARA